MRGQLPQGRRYRTGPRRWSVGLLAVCLLATACPAMLTQWRLFSGLDSGTHGSESNGEWSDLLEIAGGFKGIVVVEVKEEVSDDFSALSEILDCSATRESVLELFTDGSFWPDRCLDRRDPIGSRNPGMCAPCMYVGTRQTTVVSSNSDEDWAMLLCFCHISEDMWNDAANKNLSSGSIIRLIIPDPRNPFISIDGRRTFFESTISN